ncbi:MAG: glucosamine-6-phosphate deaminase [Acidimicrobiia bacterium]
MAPAVRVTPPLACTVVVENSINALARDAADAATAAISASIAARGTANVMFASGASQLAFLDELMTRPGVDWARVTGFHMDEYVGISGDDPSSFARYMRERIVARAHPAEFHYLDGLADPEAECARYAALLARHPLDLCCLGIGENGHLAFNDPPVADFSDPERVKVVALDDACKRQQVGEGHFPNLDAVPSHAMTVTIPVLLTAGAVLAIVPESRKAVAVRDALDGPVTTSCPASILQQTAHAVVYLDGDSASLLTLDR